MIWPNSNFEDNMEQRRQLGIIDDDETAYENGTMIDSPHMCQLVLILRELQLFLMLGLLKHILVECMMEILLHTIL